MKRVSVCFSKCVCECVLRLQIFILYVYADGSCKCYISLHTYNEGKQDRQEYRAQLTLTDVGARYNLSVKNSGKIDTTLIHTPLGILCKVTYSFYFLYCDYNALSLVPPLSVSFSYVLLYLNLISFPFKAIYLNSMRTRIAFIPIFPFRTNTFRIELRRDDFVSCLILYVEKKKKILRIHPPDGKANFLARNRIDRQWRD